MRRPVSVCALFLAAAAALAAQQNPYSGTSNPPPDTTIIDNTPPPAPPVAKPSPMHLAQPATPVQPQAAPTQKLAPQFVPAASVPDSADGTDDGIVQVAPSGSQPALNERVAVTDPDGDIVHPAPPPPGVLASGTEIRARLLDRLSSADSQSGERFRCRIASDVFRDDQVLIPAGSEIDGTVVQVSSGHFAGHGSMLLRPETVILPDGTRFRLYAQTSGAPDSNARVGGEGVISPGSHRKKDGIEYGGAVGAGAITGAILGGPPGALAGTLIGAGAVTVHLLVNHPQATLEPGAVLLFSLTEPLNLASAPPSAPSQSDHALPQAQPAPDAQSSTDAQPSGNMDSATVTQN
jgi:hypothetical protein